MRRALIVAGALVMAYALIGALGDPGVNLIGVAVFLVAVLALHDGVFLPLVLAAGAMIGRRPTVRLVAIVDLAVLVVALPLLLVPGGDRPYGAGLLLILGVTAVAAALGRKGMERWRNGSRRRRRG